MCHDPNAYTSATAKTTVAGSTCYKGPSIKFVKLRRCGGVRVCIGALQGAVKHLMLRLYIALIVFSVSDLANIT